MLDPSSLHGFRHVNTSQPLESWFILRTVSEVGLCDSGLALRVVITYVKARDQTKGPLSDGWSGRMMMPRTSRGVRTSKPPAEPRQVIPIRRGFFVVGTKSLPCNFPLCRAVCISNFVRDRHGTGRVRPRSLPIRVVSGTCARIGTIKPPTLLSPYQARPAWHGGDGLRCRECWVRF